MSDASTTPALPPGKWVKGMKSPHPAGRPKGALSKRDKVAQALNEGGPAVARVVVESALNGDMTAAGLVLSRIAPPLRAKPDLVQFQLNSDLPLAEQARQIMQAVADAKLDADTARILIGCLNSVAGIEAVAELENRIVLLESKAVN
jgi:hypothetical protein